MKDDFSKKNTIKETEEILPIKETIETEPVKTVVEIAMEVATRRASAIIEAGSTWRIK